MARVTLLDENPIEKLFRSSASAEAKHCGVHFVWDVLLCLILDYFHPFHANYYSSPYPPSGLSLPNDQCGPQSVHPMRDLRDWPHIQS